jgi:transposase InsO family protein
LPRRAAIFEYIEAFYNVQRRHSSLDHVSPLEYGAVVAQVSAFDAAR